MNETLYQTFEGLHFGSFYFGFRAYFEFRTLNFGFF